MNARGMVTLENAVLIIVVALGLLAMQAYLRRSIQANWRSNADSVSDEQYDTKGRTAESFLNTHPRLKGQPQITLGLNPNPSIAGNYSANTHIGAFRRKDDASLEPRVLDVVSSGSGKPAIFSVKDWQKPCVGDSEAGCGGGDDDEE